MPESKSRHPHKHSHQNQHHPATELPAKPKKTNRAMMVAVIFFAVLGLCIGLFIDATSITTLLAGTVLGAAAGFLAGYFINKSLSGK